MQRRELVKAMAGAAAVLQIEPLLRLTAAEPGAPLFFTKDEFTALDDLTEIIIPTDSHSPGAKAAGVAAYIDRSVAEAFLPEEKVVWRNGLAPFVGLSKVKRNAMLTEIAANEENPQSDAAKFFTQLKQATVFAYYTSNVGIHEDIGYVGNVIQQQFSGFEVS